MTNIRARELIHETLVYRFYPWSTNHFPPWIRPDVPNPNGYTVFNQDIYRINSADGTCILYLGNIDDVFEIQSDGLIVTRGSLDRELRSRYILTVEVELSNV